SSGRSARNSVPVEVVTTQPSGWPMSSSWATDPRWVCSTSPSTRVIVDMRPLESVSCTRSPDRNGPERWRAPVRGVVTVADSMPGDARAGPAALQSRENLVDVDLDRLPRLEPARRRGGEQEHLRAPLQSACDLADRERSFQCGHDAGGGGGLHRGGGRG